MVNGLAIRSAAYVLMTLLVVAICKFSGGAGQVGREVEKRVTVYRLPWRCRMQHTPSWLAQQRPPTSPGLQMTPLPSPSPPCACSVGGSGSCTCIAYTLGLSMACNSCQLISSATAILTSSREPAQVPQHFPTRHLPAFVSSGRLVGAPGLGMVVLQLQGHRRHDLPAAGPHAVAHLPVADDATHACAHTGCGE